VSTRGGSGEVIAKAETVNEPNSGLTLISEEKSNCTKKTNCDVNVEELDL
jgi:hypothetical protein